MPRSRNVIFSFVVVMAVLAGCGGATQGGGGTPVPAAPTGVTVVAGDGKGTVSWSASAGATSYNLYWSTSAAVSKANGTKVAGAASPMVVIGLANGTPFYFVVTAVNLGGESAESSTATATPVPTNPAAPTSVAAAAGNGQVTVTWSASAGATSYNLYWSTSAAISKANGTKVAGTSSPAVVSGLANGTAFFFVVTALNLGGESAESSAAAATPMPPIPAAPTSIAAAVGNGQATITWSVSAGATSYNLYWSTAASVSKATGTRVAGTSSPAVVSGLANGTDFFFVVTAVNLGGESAESSAANATPVPPISTAPTSVAAAAGIGQVTVMWSVSAGATSYNLYWSTSASVSKTNGTKVAGTSSPAVVSGLANGTPFYFVVTAVNLGGESAESSAATATPVLLIPPAPTSVAAAAGNGQVTVTWSVSAGATSYNLYWSTAASVSKATGTKVAGAVSGAAVAGLAGGTTYHFVVTAVNATGESIESMLATVTTPLPYLVGSFSFSGAGGTDLAVDSSSKRVYVSGGMGQQGLIRIDASNPLSMSQSTLSYGGGIAADSQTGRYATTNGYTGGLFIFNPDDTLYDTKAITGCGGSLAADPATGRFFISSQCSDHVAVYGEASKSIVANIADPGTGSSVVFDQATGKIFENLTPNTNWGAAGPLVVDASYSATSPLSGVVLAADGALRHLYVAANNGNFLVLDDATYSTLHTFPAASFSHVAADTTLGRFYASSGNVITAYDASTYAPITTVTLPGTIQNMQMVPGDSRLYAIDASHLYVVQTVIQTQALPVLLGSFSFTGAGGTELAVDSSLKRVYVSGGMGQQGLIRIDASNPLSMSQSTLSYGGGIAADSQTGRYATTNGYTGGLFIFNPDDTLYDTKAITGCGGSLAADPATGRFFISSQCSDHVAVYGEASKSIVANIADPGTGSSVVFDQATGKIFENLTPNTKWGAAGPLVVDASYSATSPFSGVVLAADGALRHLYVAANNGNFLVLDDTTYSTLHTLPAASFSHVAADTTLGRFYASSGNVITAYDASTYAPITTLTLPGTIQNMQMVPGDSWLYAIDASHLYVVQTVIQTQPLPWLLGSFSFTGAGGTDLAVDSSLKRVYVSGGMGQQGLIRIDASSPLSMSQRTLSYGGGIAADSQTGRYATTNGYSGGLFVFNADDTLYDTKAISGCGGSLAVDPATGRFFISSQCSDHVAVYGEASKSIVANIADPGTGSSVVFDPASGKIFENLTPNTKWGGAGPLVVDASYLATSPFSGVVLAADGALRHLYVAANNGDFLVLDGATYSTLHTFPAASFSHVAADTTLGRFYASSGNVITAYDASTYAPITTLTLPGTIQNMQMVPGDSRLYAIDASHLYVVQPQ